jgi:hypothetical protein
VPLPPPPNTALANNRRDGKKMPKLKNKMQKGVNMNKSVIAITMITLVAAAALRAADTNALEALTQLAPEYTNYGIQSVSLPVTIPDVSLKVISRVNCFVGVGPAGSGGIQITPTESIGRVDLNDKEKEQAAKIFAQAVTDAISKELKVTEDSNWLLLVVSGKGGGMIMGEGGYIDAEIFLLDTKGKTLVAYSKDPMGKGNTVNAALQDLAVDVTQKVLEMAKQGK